jgi:hypothetical protein
MHGSQLKASAEVPRAGNYLLMLTCRAIHKNLRVRISITETTIAEFVTKDPIVDLHRDIVLRCPAVLRAGKNVFTVDIEPLDLKMANIENRLLFINWHVEPTIRPVFSFANWKRVEGDNWITNLGLAQLRKPIPHLRPKDSYTSK